jgi:hypothetical protein
MCEDPIIDASICCVIWQVERRPLHRGEDEDGQVG